MGSGANASLFFSALRPTVCRWKRGAQPRALSTRAARSASSFAPILQKLIQALGWMGAMWSLAVMVLAALPLIRNVASEPGQARRRIRRRPLAERQGSDARSQLLLLHAGFFTCGFHIAFLVTHLPGEVGLCGLPPSVASWSLGIIGLANVVGGLFAGNCVARYRSKYILFCMYGSRAVDRHLSRHAAYRDDLLPLCGRPWIHLARHGAAHGGDHRQAVRCPSPRHAVRADLADAPDRRLSRRLVGRACRQLRRLLLGCGTPTWHSPRWPRSSTCRSAKRRSTTRLPQAAWAPPESPIYST